MEFLCEVLSHVKKRGQHYFFIIGDSNKKCINSISEYEDMYVGQSVTSRKYARLLGIYYLAIKTNSTTT